LILRVIFIAWLIIVPLKVMATDFSAMEAMTQALDQSAIEMKGSTDNCDQALAERIGQELQNDFDFCQPERQPALVSKGLYLSLEGIIKPLWTHEQPLRPKSKVVIPLPVKGDVPAEPHTPFVIDLTVPTSDESFSGKQIILCVVDIKQTQRWLLMAFA
jgi:predicted carbohydrate-binding protein with CBM5 and CBM33 domain